MQTPEGLEKVLKEDPLTRMIESVQKIAGSLHDELDEKFGHMVAVFARLEERGLREEARQLNIATREGVVKLAQLIEHDVDEVDAYLELSTRAHTAYKEAPEMRVFMASWKDILSASPIEQLDALPTDDQMPCIVFYSAEWCPPCWFTKPAFVALAPYFTQAPLFYIDDEVLRREAGVEYIPQLVACFPGEKRVSSNCGSTTQELWDNLNALISLGAAFHGNAGSLVCDESGCRVESIT